MRAVFDFFDILKCSDKYVLTPEDEKAKKHF